MEIFTKMIEDEYEQVLYCYDKPSGLKAIIVIHDTTLGPALGGARMWPYETEAEALEDALRLSKGMTYKNAAAGLALGGGKTVIIRDSKKDKHPDMLKALGHCNEGLNGQYITAEDVGTTVEYMEHSHEVTDHVAGTSPETGSSGDHSPVTAYWIYKGIKAAAKEAYGSDSLEGKTVAVQGVGNVAYKLCGHLHNENAKLIVTDINSDAVERAVKNYGALAVDPDEIYDVECDIYAPCALGATINSETIPRLKAKVIAGSANNQLKTSEDGDALFERGITYAPDYVINSGGVINVADELKGYNQEHAMKKVETIYDSLTKTFEISKRDHLPSHIAADRMVEERITSAKK